MARIVYALSGQGRGHSSRCLAISSALRKRDHDILVCCSGTAKEIMEARGEQVIDVPHIRTVLRDNVMLPASTLIANLKAIMSSDLIVARLADTLRPYRADLVITDFEPFSWRAADKLGIPIISFNHQQVVTETSYDLPTEHWIDAQVAKAIINIIAPRNPELLLLTSFYFPPVRRPGRTRLIAPIIRKQVEGLVATPGEHILVYYNQPEGHAEFPDLLRKDGRPFVVYNFPQPPDPESFPNVTFKRVSIADFLQDLATCRAVLCTAGFTLISEALYLGKPLLAVPNRGIFEQTLNALFLEQEGLGAAVIGRNINADDLEAFHSRADHFATTLRSHRVSGNQEAIAAIEGVLNGTNTELSTHMMASISPFASVRAAGH